MTEDVNNTPVRGQIEAVVNHQLLTPMQIVVWDCLDSAHRGAVAEEMWDTGAYHLEALARLALNQDGEQHDGN